MHQDEKDLQLAIAQKGENETVRDIISVIGMDSNRAHYLLEKWVKQGFYEYGVSIDLGWFTEKGWIRCGGRKNTQQISKTDFMVNLSKVADRQRRERK